MTNWYEVTNDKQLHEAMYEVHCHTPRAALGELHQGSGGNSGRIRQGSCGRMIGLTPDSRKTNLQDGPIISGLSHKNEHEASSGGVLFLVKETARDSRKTLYFM